MTERDNDRLARVETKVDFLLEDVGCLVKIVKGDGKQEGLLTQVSRNSDARAAMAAQRKMVWGALITAISTLAVQLVGKLL